LASRNRNKTEKHCEKKKVGINEKKKGGGQTGVGVRPRFVAKSTLTKPKYQKNNW